MSKIRKDSCNLTWTAPATDGGTPITGYIIERRTGSTWIALKKQPTGTQFTVERLTEGNKYEFRVIAENKAGQGKPSGPSQQITTKDPWSELLHYEA